MSSITSQHRTDAVVVGTDGTPDGRAAVRRAAIVAAHRDVPLHIVHAYELDDTVEHRAMRTVAPRDVAESISGRGEAFEILSEARADLKAEDLEVHCHAVRGSVATALRHVAEEHGASLVVVGGTPPRGLAGRFRRTVARALAQHAAFDVESVGAGGVVSLGGYAGEADSSRVLA